MASCNVQRPAATADIEKMQCADTDLHRAAQHVGVKLVEKGVFAGDAAAENNSFNRQPRPFMHFQNVPGPEGRGFQKCPVNMGRFGLQVQAQNKAGGLPRATGCR